MSTFPLKTPPSTDQETAGRSAPTVPGGGHQIDLTGGESVYCINTFQMQKAEEIYAGEGETSEKLRDVMNRLESELDRNERAAVAMLLLQRLNRGPLN